MPQLSVRLPDDFMAELEKRGDRATVIRETLERHFSLLARARPSLREALTPDEISLIADAGNGVLYEAWSIPHLSAGVADSIALDGLDAKWGVDGPALVEKLRRLDAAQTFALADAVERYWKAVGRGEEMRSEDLLK